MSFLLDGFMAVTWQQAVMYVIGILLIYLAIKKNYEPSLLLPMGFGAILVNLPFSEVCSKNQCTNHTFFPPEEWFLDLKNFETLPVEIVVE